ncbi:single-stranded DNA-binding protein [Aeromicrobium sp. Leaf350]|uniref:single-stranded DNA-binding protein n=1 Tax=Aeromicrobium sp. Leaf350 TaxID=2876565 RepID=UPI001E4F38DB|nr:single-stranded DNA-binding protein [Aeromicrobium sp. Leaf350]
MDETTINDVRLRGRVSGDPETRVLPSGDELVSLRLVVPRSAAARKRSKATVDTIELTAWTAALRRTVGRLSSGDVVEVSGELRRRFARGAGGAQSFMGVDLTACRRVRPEPPAR